MYLGEGRECQVLSVRDSLSDRSGEEGEVDRSARGGWMGACRRVGGVVTMVGGEGASSSSTSRSRTPRFL